MPGTTTSFCETDPVVVAEACQPGVFYWQDYDLLGEEWNNYAKKWEDLS